MSQGASQKFPRLRSENIEEKPKGWNVPKIVDHDSRRRDLIEATLRIIVRQGLSGATMRDIATEAGFANGALKPYFTSKSDLLSATYMHVFDATNRRVEQATLGLSGLAALQAFAQEVLPVDDDLRDEARVVLSFWGEVAQNPLHARTTQETLEPWRARIIVWLEEARLHGELDPDVDIPTEADMLLTYMMGAQVNRIAVADRFNGAAFTAQFAYYMGRLRRGPRACEHAVPNGP